MDKRTERRIMYLENKVAELEHRLNQMQEAWEEQIEIDRQLSNYRKTGSSQYGRGCRPGRWD